MYLVCTPEFPGGKSRHEGEVAPLGRAAVLISRGVPKIASWLPHGYLLVSWCRIKDPGRHRGRGSLLW